MLWSRLLALLVGAALAAPPAAAAPPMRLLIVDGNPGARSETTLTARRVAALVPEFFVIGEVETREIVDSVRELGVTCAFDEPACASRLAALGDAQAVLSLSERDGRLVARLIDAASSAERAAVDRVIPVGKERLGIETAIMEVLAPTRNVGTLVLSGGPDGGIVFVDDQETAKLPLTEGIVVKAGERRIVVESAGVRFFEQVVDVPLQSTSAIVLPSSLPSGAAPGAGDELALSSLLLTSGVIGAAVFGVASVLITGLAVGVFYVGCDALGAARAHPNNGMCFDPPVPYANRAVPDEGTQSYVVTLTAVNAVAWAAAVVSAVLGVAGLGLVGASFVVE